MNMFRKIIFNTVKNILPELLEESAKEKPLTYIQATSKGIKTIIPLMSKDPTMRLKIDYISQFDTNEDLAIDGIQAIYKFCLDPKLDLTEVRDIKGVGLHISISSNDKIRRKYIIISDTDYHKCIYHNEMKKILEPLKILIEQYPELML